MSFLDKLRATIRSIYELGELIGIQSYRKTKKQFRHYMAPERAEKILKKQETIPRRAPMNLRKIEFSPEKIDANKETVKEMLKKNDELLKNLKNIHVVSTELSDEHANTKSKPAKRTLDLSPAEETPRGLVTASVLVEILHNMHMQPSEWTSKEVSQRFNLRENDVEDFIEFFRLVKKQDCCP